MERGRLVMEAALLGVGALVLVAAQLSNPSQLARPRWACP